MAGASVCWQPQQSVGEVLHDDGFGGVPQQRVQGTGYPPQVPPGHVNAMPGPRNQGLHCS